MTGQVVTTKVKQAMRDALKVRTPKALKSSVRETGTGKALPTIARQSVRHTLSVQKTLIPQKRTLPFGGAGTSKLQGEPQHQHVFA